MRVLYGSWREHLNRAGKPEDDPLVMPWLFSKPFREQFPEKVKAIKADFTTGYLSRSSEAFERQVKANVTHNTKSSLRELKMPVLILAGKYDALTPPRLAKEIKAEIPHARAVFFEEGGHGLYWEVPHLFNRTVLDFLFGQN